MPTRSDEFVVQDLGKVGHEFTTAYGLDGVKAKIARFVGLLEKWKKLTEGLENDPEGLAEVYWKEIYSKIDPKTYGM